MTRGLSRFVPRFSKPSGRYSRRSTHQTLRVEGLECRRVLAVEAVPLMPLFASPVDTPVPMALVIAPASAASAAPAVNATASLGQQVASYLSSKLGTRVGGGECAHVATEALRASGAQFIFTPQSGPSGYLWSASPPVALLTNGSQVVGKRFQVGDIVQLEKAAFSTGRFIRHHTQVVAAVDANGRITKVFEQNVGGKRTVQRNNAVDLTKLTSGSVAIYRPNARVDQPGRLQYTIVNNTPSNQTFVRQVGTQSTTLSLGKANTVGSYRYVWLTPNSAAVTLKAGTSAVQIQNAGAYELYLTTAGQVAVRRMS